jgi:hypothetical protein
MPSRARPGRATIEGMRRVLLGLVAGAAFVGMGASAERAASPRPLDPVDADAVFGAIASRFGPVELDSSLRAARPKFARDSLSPSRLVDDPALWTFRQGEERRLDFGAEAGLPFRVGLAHRPRPGAAGTYRGTIGLRRMDADEFEWRVSDELGLGPGRRGTVDSVLASALQALESESDALLRRAVRAALPRSAARFGRLYAIDRLESRPAPGGGAELTVEVRMDPAGIADSFPRYARFISTYLATARYALTLADDGGAAFVEMSGKDLRTVVRLRLRQGRLCALVGSPRPMPGRLVATMSSSIRSGLVRVGVDRLVGQVEVADTPGERGFRARFSAAPEFKLPFLVKPFLMSSLRRPFEGEGAGLELLLLESPAEGARFRREYRFTVKESWIVRWLGSFGGGMATVFRAGAEAEADRFDGECLWALRDDVVAYATEKATRAAAVSPRR